MGIFGNSGRDSSDEGLQRRVEELERRVAALEWAARSAGQAAPTAVVGQPGLPGDAGISPEVQQLVMQGKKIQAIKLLREQSGLGLREAKDIVDRL